jgi:Tn3 transposase DDE domain-containing protein
VLVGYMRVSMNEQNLIRTLQTKDRPTRLALALEELGRLVKTLYLLRYIDDEPYRRRILVQLNRGEGRHQLARTVFHGKRGELRQRYHKGQEDQLGALGLVVNVIVLWNTIYMDAGARPAPGRELRPARRGCGPPVAARVRSHQHARPLRLRSARYRRPRRTPANA